MQAVKTVTESTKMLKGPSATKVLPQGQQLSLHEV